MVDGINVSTNVARFGQVNDDSSSTAAGTLRGDKVIEERSIRSLVLDSLEEDSFAVTVQAKSVDVDEVEVEDASIDLAGRLKKFDRLRDDMDKARSDLSPEKLRKLLAALRSSGGGEDAAARIAQQFEDPTDQFLALEAVMERLGRDRGDRELRKAARKASDTLWEKHSREIVAGLHASLVAQRFAHGDVAQFQALREAYRDQVTEQPTVLKSLKKLRERFGDDKLGEEMKFLIAAAGQDLGARVSSTDKATLEHLVGELSRLELLSSMRGDAGKIVGRVRKRFSLMNDRKDWDLLENSLELMEDEWLNAQKVETLATSVGNRNIEAQIYFTRELNAFFRDIPTKAWTGLDRRTQVLDASQEVLDQLIEREEDEY